MLKLCLVGCGAIVVNSHLPALHTLRDVWRIAWVVDPDSAARTRVARQESCGHSDSIDGIPADVDACLVAVPNHLHGAVSANLLSRGFHVLCEKPMADCVAACVPVMASASGAARFALVHQMRFDASVAVLQRLLEWGTLGQIRHVDIAFGNPFGWISRTNFYRSEALAGGGVLMDLGCHLLDLCLFLFGRPSIEGGAILYEAGTRRMDLAATIEIALPGEVTGTIRVSRIATLENAVRVSGERSVAVAKLGGNAVSISGEQDERLQGAGGDPFVEIWRAFALADTRLSDAAAGRGVMELIEASYERLQRLEEAVG